MRERFGAASPELSEVRRRLQAWRQVHGGRGRRLPEELWADIVSLAEADDAGAVARALRLNPDSLARRMSAEPASSPAVARRPVFVEVAPAMASPVGGGCRVELTGADGGRVSIHFADPSTVDLVALAGGLLRATR